MTEQNSDCIAKDSHDVKLTGGEEVRTYTWPEPVRRHGRQQRGAIGAILVWLDINPQATGKTRGEAVTAGMDLEKLCLVANRILDFFYKYNNEMRKDQKWLDENAANDAEIIEQFMALWGYLSRPFVAKKPVPIDSEKPDSTEPLPPSGELVQST